MGPGNRRGGPGTRGAFAAGNAGKDRGPSRTPPPARTGGRCGLLGFGEFPAQVGERVSFAVCCRAQRRTDRGLRAALESNG